MLKNNTYSIVIPIYNEAANLKNLVSEIDNVLYNKMTFELIFVDDGSNDSTQKTLQNIILNKKYLKIKSIKNEINQGQSYSILEGVRKAKYQNIITMDGDSQNDPNDIFKLEKIYSNNINIKLVGGLRKKRMDSTIKIISSKSANFIRKRILNDKCDDTGCSLKIFDKDIFISFPFFDGIHRFLPALFSGFGFKTSFVSVNHRKRKIGKSNYGTFKRLLKGIRDIMIVKKIISNKNKLIKL